MKDDTIERSCSTQGIDARFLEKLLKSKGTIQHNGSRGRWEGN
jgi:hypothetical protein